MEKRITIYLVGMIVSAFGIALIIMSMAGAGPWDVVSVGLNKHFGLTIGMWSIIAQSAVVIVTGIIEGKRLQWGSVVAIIIRSWILDFWIYVVFKNIDFTSSLEFQWFSFVMGVVIVGMGIGIYMEAQFPKTPIDGLMIALHDRFGWSLNASRIAIESSAAFLGLLLGGPLGIGTLIIALFLGKIIQMSNSIVKRMLHSEGMVLSKS